MNPTCPKCHRNDGQMKWYDPGRPVLWACTYCEDTYTPAPVSDKGCELDTDGDGNCPIHPEGCPKPQPPVDAVLSEVARAVALQIADCRGPGYRFDLPKATALLAAFAEREYDRGRLDEHRAKLTCVGAGCEQEVTAPYCGECLAKKRAETIEECAKLCLPLHTSEDPCPCTGCRTSRINAERIRSLTRAGSAKKSP